jgi:predicted transcriptional regulator
MAIVGTARLRTVHSCPPDDAWSDHHRSFGLSREEFDVYLDGSDRAYLLLLHHVQTLNMPLYLRKLREDGPFQPPQSFRYVAPSDPVSVRELVSV